MNTSGLMTSDYGGWRTPEWIVNLVRRIAPIALDPCAAREGDFVGAAVRWTSMDDGLAQDWETVAGLAYVNPPYGRGIGAWVEKCATRWRGETIALIPARTDTAWWHASVPSAAAVCFLRGRVSFIAADGSVDGAATFPSAIVYWGACRPAFAAAFHDAGQLVQPL